MVFFFNDTATTEIYTLSLHDALPISSLTLLAAAAAVRTGVSATGLTVSEMVCGTEVAMLPPSLVLAVTVSRSEEDTSALQSPCKLVCRLLLDKKNAATVDGAGLTVAP